MELERAKGTRDFLPEEKILRDNIVSKIKEIFELYGYNPLETPIIERYETLSSKYAGGAEILKETFKLKDQGKRQLGLRYDLTVPLARVIGMNPNLKLPFKRYQIGEVFRDGPLKTGRYRQFTQCDVDVIGIKQMTADSEILALTKNIFNKLNLDIVIKVNNRKLLNGILNQVKISKNKQESIIISLDKIEKIGIEEVKKELNKKGLDKKQIEILIEKLILEGTNKSKLSEIKIFIDNKEGEEGIKEIEELLKYLEVLDTNVIFDLSLARGLSYYTGTVFEVYLKKGEVKSSLAAGGRYDKMISSFLNTTKEYPAVGISFGLDIILETIKLKKIEVKKSIVQVYIIPIKTLEDSLKIAQKLRDNGIKIDIDLMERGVIKNLEYCNNLEIPYVIFIGKKELAIDKLKLRNMKTGNEEYLSIDELIKKLSN